MRVVVNQLAALGQRTGIGHYTVELLRCLKAQAGTDVVESFPDGLVRRVREAAARARPRLEGKGNEARPGPASGPSPLGRLRRSALHYLRQGGRALIAWHFR